MTASPSKPLTVPAQPLSPPAVKSQKSTETSAGVGATASATFKSDTATSVSAPAANSTVRISAAALAALKEARETPAQTAAEARHGDAVAKSIVARQRARAAEFKKNSR